MHTWQGGLPDAKGEACHPAVCTRETGREHPPTLMSSSTSRPAFLMALALLAAGCATMKAGPLLINAQQASFRTRPEYVREHFAHIETLPFDGLVLSTATGRALMSGTARSYAQIDGDFAPLGGLAFTRMKHNFALVNVDRPADFFGDWSVTIENFRLLARVLKEKGVEGIFFDNEDYDRPLFNHPEDCSDPAKSLAEYRAQARLRGRQIMQAVAGEYPGIVVMAFHGPYSSAPDTPDAVRRGQTNWQSEELRGPFSAGFIEGLDSRSRFIDGGEVYAYRTVADFQGSYDYRKTGIATVAADCPFIDAFLRPVWPLKVGISFGVYNLPFGGQSMNPTIMRPTLERALRRCDSFVWLYSEELNWNAPGEAAQSWVDAVVGARAAAQDPPASAPPSVSITSPALGSGFNAPATITIAANASDSDGSVSKVEFFNATTKLGESLVPPYSLAWVNPAAGTYSLTAKATDNSGAVATSSVVSVAVSATFSARINFQGTGMTAPAGYFADPGKVYAARGNGLTYGWNVSHTEYTRESANGMDRRFATLCRFRSGGVWEIALPNGTYDVTVAVGDADEPSAYTINVEGTVFWNAQNLAAGQFMNQTHAVAVSDGRLTIDQGSAAHESTRIDYVLIAAASAAPAAPGALTAIAPSSTSVELTWADHSSAETGFQLRRSLNADFSASTLIATLSANTTSHLDAGLNAGTTYYYRVRSTSAAGNSAYSATVPMTPPMPDADGDGIPDPLENAPYGVGVDDRQIDSDGDGSSNAAEYSADTDPLDHYSRLQVAPSTPGASGTATAVMLAFSTVAGMNYAVAFTDFLVGGIWTLVPDSERTGDGALQYVEETSATPARFYRLHAWR